MWTFFWTISFSILAFRTAASCFKEAVFALVLSNMPCHLAMSSSVWASSARHSASCSSSVKAKKLSDTPENKQKIRKINKKNRLYMTSIISHTKNRGGILGFRVILLYFLNLFPFQLFQEPLEHPPLPSYPSFQLLY